MKQHALTGFRGPLRRMGFGAASIALAFGAALVARGGVVAETDLTTEATTPVRSHAAETELDRLHHLQREISSAAGVDPGQIVRLDVETVAGVPVPDAAPIGD